jgi:hypothetical protein
VPTESGSAPLPDPIAWQLVLIALAWASLWLQFAIIPFFNRREDLVRNYSTNGLLAAVFSRIENSEVIPALVALYDEARSQQVDKRHTPVMEALLSQTGYVKYIEQIESAIGEKRGIEDDFRRLGQMPTLIWSLGLAHILLVVFLASWDCGICPHRSKPASYAIVVFALLTLGALLWKIAVFHRIMGRFTTAMDRHQEKQP